MNDKRKVWPIFHRAVFSFAVTVAALCIIGMAGIAFAGVENSGVTTVTPGDCGVRILISAKDGGFKMSRQAWTLTSKNGVAAHGTNHTARVYVPAGTYTFATAGKSKSARVGAVANYCDGRRIDTTFYGSSK